MLGLSILHGLNPSRANRYAHLIVLIHSSKDAWSRLHKQREREREREREKRKRERERVLSMAS